MKIINALDEELKGKIDNKEFFGEGLTDSYVIIPDKFGDSRGYFSPYFINKNLQKIVDLPVFGDIVQCNRSLSKKGSLRGLHYQLDPKCQSKIVEVLSGSAIDVIVDIRPDSPTFGKWFGIKLSAENGRQLLVPKGFAHGFLALEDNTLFQYLVDNDYAPSLEAGIPWDDKSIGIDWDLIFSQYGIKKEDLELSPKDKEHSGLLQKVARNEIPFRRSIDLGEVIKKNNTKIMITGGAGQLGYDVIKELNRRGYYNIYAPTINELDLRNKKAVDRAFKKEQPNVVIHCAAYTAVDNAEDDLEGAFRINVDATDYIAENCKKADAKLIYISTDYVFDGTKDLSLVYDVDDMPNPKSIYGKTKLLGERKALNNPKTFIARTSWVFGINGKNFMKSMLNLAETRNELKVVADQYGSPTYTVDLARLLVDMAESDKYGIYHANNEGYCSWAEFAEEIFRQNNLNVKVDHVTTEEYYEPLYKKAKEQGKSLTVADRPRNSKLSKTKLIDNDFELLPSWKDAVRRYSKELKLKKEEEKNQG